MTRAVVATAYGGAEVLDVVDVELPSPEGGEVLVDLRAGAYNPADWKIYGGLWGTSGALPRRVGLEGSGVVAAVGPGVTRFSVGDEVVAHPAGGSFAEQVLVPERVLEHKPASLGWEAAAGLLLAGTTAWHALDAVGLGVSDGHLGLASTAPTGHALLVHGGAGGVGSVVVQLAVARGVRVIATSGAANEDYVRSLGAEPVRYGDGLADRVRALGSVTAAIDTVGTQEAIDVSVELVPREHVATVAGLEYGAAFGIHLLGHGPGMDPGKEVRAAARRPLLELAAAGVITVRIAEVFPLERIREAHGLVVSGHAPGKVVLVP